MNARLSSVFILSIFMFLLASSAIADPTDGHIVLCDSGDCDTFAELIDSNIHQDGNGLIGIGDDSPSGILELGPSQAGGAGLVFQTYGSYGPIIGTVSGSNAGHLYLRPVSGYMRMYDGSTDFNFDIYSGSTRTVLLNSNGDSYFNGGDVGIGTPSPEFTLDVSGTFRATGLSVDSSSPPNIIGGYSDNTVSGDPSPIGVVIAGGGLSGTNKNEAHAYFVVIGGGYNNESSASASIISGGADNTINSGSDYSVIGGGISNTIASTYGDWAVIAGGKSNSAGNYYATVSGGYSNNGDGEYCSIGGGYSHVATGDSSTIAGGYDNSITGDFSTISGGESNEITGEHSTIAGGNNNGAYCDDCFVAGSNASSSYAGSFVWCDHDSTCAATAYDQFMVHADGGAWFSHNVSALSFTDRTPYPDSLETAYAAVLSMRRLPDGQYDPNDESMQLDHTSLTNFVLSSVDEEGGIGRNLSATVSAQNEVIKDLIVRIAQLEQLCSTR